MSRLHVVIEAEAGSSLVRTDVLPFAWPLNPVTSAHIRPLGDATGPPLQHLGVFVLRIRRATFTLEFPSVVIQQSPLL